MDSDPQSSLLPVLNWFGPGSTTLILRQIDIPVLYIWNYSVMYLWLARNTKDWISANLVQFLHKISCLTSWEIDAGRPRYARRLATGSLCKITLVGPTLYSRGGWISLNLQSWARMTSEHKVVCNYHFTIFVVATPSRHWALTIFRIFSGPWLVLDALLRCRFVVVPKLKNCRVPSSGAMYRLKLPNFTMLLHTVRYVL